MPRRWPTKVIVVLIALAVAGGMFALGRATAGRPAAGGQSPTADAGYANGLIDGRAAGVQEGRALQIGQPLPSGSRDLARDAFNAGYTAGTNDAFGGYDGGWSMSRPYLITLVPGTGPITYRIASRTELQPDTNYHLCPGSASVCSEPRR